MRCCLVQGPADFADRAMELTVFGGHFSRAIATDVQLQSGGEAKHRQSERFWESSDCLDHSALVCRWLESTRLWRWEWAFRF